MSEALQRELERRIAGEVRFDRVSRALYATDASVYQIEPLGVVVARTPADVVAAVDAARRHRVPITMRGGGTSQAGQAIGPGVVVDTSKYFNRVLEINPSERWARVEPGVVLDELNAVLRSHGLRFAPDISTASRATVGGMMANNSSCARSLIYGKTIDHVIEQEVVLSDGSIAHFHPLSPTELEAACAAPTLEAQIYREVSNLCRQHRDDIEKRFPKILRSVGGYNLHHFLNEEDFNLCKLIVGSEGTLGIITEAKLNLVTLPGAKAVLVAHFSDLLTALGTVPLILKHNPSAIEVVDKFILDNTRQNPAYHRMRQFIQGDPGALLMVEFHADQSNLLPLKLAGLQHDLSTKGLAYHCHTTME